MTVFPLSTVPLSEAFPPDPLSNAFVDLIEEGGEGIYLVEISAYKGGLALSGGLATLTEIPLTDIPLFGDVSVGLVTLRYADQHWIGDPSDPIMPNIYYEGRVTVPLVIDRNMPVLPEDTRRVQRQFGNIEIDNTDSALDPVLQTYAVDGRRVRVLFGPRGGEYSDFGVIADVLGTGWEGDEGTVRLSVRDQTYSVDLPVQTNLYLGTGGAEGTDENKGKPKPLAFGRLRNITPVMIDPVNRIFQWHDGASHALDDVWERGLALTDSGSDVASYAALVAASVPASNYTTCLAESMFKLGSSPAGLITCDVLGDVTPDYADTFDVIAQRILRQRAGIDPRWINASTFAGAAVVGGELGLYVSSDIAPSTADVMNLLTSANGSWWGSARDGRIRAGRLVDPAPLAPNLYLDEFDGLAVEPEQAIVPRWRQRVGYQPNWTPQRGEDLSAAVTEERKQFLTAVSRVVTSADASVRLRHLQALDPAPVQSLYENASDAETLANYLMELHAPDRRIFRVTVKRFGYLIDLGAIVHLRYPKFNLQNGQKFIVIGIREDADLDEQIIRLWG